MFNSQRFPKLFLVAAAAALFAIAGCSKQAEQATNQAPPPPKKAVTAKSVSKPAAPKATATKPVAKKPESGKVVAAKAPAPKPQAASTKTASNKTPSSKTPSAKPVSSKVASGKPTQPTTFVTIPQGTAVRATVSQALASNKNHSGDAFAAILSSSIKVDGKTVVPKGAHVAGRVVSAKKSGPAELTVALTSVEVNGKSYKLATDPINRSGKAPAKDATDTESAKAEKDITVAAQSHLKFKLAKPAKIPVKS
jgi:starch synthase (maltosyl-transferring)